jgi:DNA-binding NarL/FixJ family response regulator
VQTSAVDPGRNDATTPQPIRVLIVDDDETFAAALTALFEADGRVEVVGWASNGAEALSLAVGRRPDIVTMDVEMPVMDGVEATRMLRAGNPPIPIVILTGSGSSPRVDDALGAGAAAQLEKRRAADELVDLLVATCTDARVPGA